MPFGFGERRRALAQKVNEQHEQLRIAPLTIVVPNGLDAQIVFTQLEDYLDVLKHDKQSKYDGNPGYCEEDEVFLTDTIDHVQLMLHHLSQQHRYLIRKM